jgi:hypothetical protein
MVCWNPLDADPDRWPVSVVPAGFRATISHPTTATALLLRLLDGEPTLLPR